MPRGLAPRPCLPPFLQVCELLDGLKVEKFHVLGFSFGGTLALQTAAAVPERVLGCVALSSPCDLYYPGLTNKERKELAPVAVPFFCH